MKKKEKREVKLSALNSGFNGSKLRVRFIVLILTLLTFVLNVTVLEEKATCSSAVSELARTKTESSKIEKIKKEKEELEKFVKEADKPDVNFESKAKSIARTFLSGWGAKVLIVISLFLSILFFFRFRNYAMALAFYIIANVLTFLGYKIARWICR